MAARYTKKGFLLFSELCLYLIGFFNEKYLLKLMKDKWRKDTVIENSTKNRVTLILSTVFENTNIMIMLRATKISAVANEALVYMCSRLSRFITESTDDMTNAFPIADIIPIIM